MQNFDQIPEAALNVIRAGQQVAIATVIETWGSAPRPVGSQLVIAQDGTMTGSVSGGCVEGSVLVEALETLESGRCKQLEFGVADEDAFAVGLACGGRIRILVEPVDRGEGLPKALLEELVARRANRDPVVLRTDLQSWDRKLLTADDETASNGLLRDRSVLDGDLFFAVHNPPLRLAIVGAVHIAQPLIVMARLAGYDVTLIDPRESFANDARFPGQTLAHAWPDDALKAHGLDTRCAVVTLTHDPKLDNPAIETALGTDVFYLGCLGSTRTHAKRVAYLQNAGFSSTQIARIHGPIGLDIGATSPSEIAISIMAEMTERLRRPETRPDTRPDTRPELVSK